jgi:hypothetical protein
MKWVYESGDNACDPGYSLLTDSGEDTGFSVQDATSYGGQWAVNQLGGKGDGLWSMQHAVCTTLAKAKHVAMVTYLKERQKLKA